MTEEPQLPPDGPTELVEGRDGEMVERLSTGTATLLLAWLIGTGAASALLAAWLLAAVFLQWRLGVGELFSAIGFYIALFGASGPVLLWLTGRAQGHSLGWFSWTAAKIALVMVAFIVLVVIAITLVMAGSLPGLGAVQIGALMAVVAIVLSQVWAVATWGADRWIARARVTEDGAGQSS